MTSSIGKPMNRLDGHLKVTGKARYAGDWNEPHLAYGVIFQSTVASGKITGFDLREAKRVKGVIDIITYENAPRLKKYEGPQPGPGESFIPLQDNKVFYNGQDIGVVVAESLEAASQAAQLVKVRYEETNKKLDLAKSLDSAYTVKEMKGLGPVNSSRGDIDKGLQGSNNKLDKIYTTPMEHHNPMEPSATLAVWGPKSIKVYDATQGVSSVSSTIGNMFKVGAENCQVITKFVGGGFGCKGSLWPHQVIAVMASEKIKRPVKLVLTRPQMFTSVGYRAKTIQLMTLGTNSSGNLQAMRHICINPTAVNKQYSERSAVPTPMLYKVDNLVAEHRLVDLNYQAPTFMRAPGESSGSFAIESSMDEMAHELNMDPIEFRLKNYADKDAGEKKEFSSKSLRQCYEQGAKAFGWNKRRQKPGSVREGDYYIGYGMATATYPAHIFPAKARVEFFNTGKAKVTSATQDIGTGTYTIMTQIAADYLTISPQDVSFDLGDSKYPTSSVSGGSTTAASVGSAIKKASQDALNQIAELAIKDEKSPLKGTKIDNLEMSDGRMYLKSNKNIGENYIDIMKRNNKDSIIAEGSVTREQNPYSCHSFGAQFAEVKIHALTGEVRLTKMTGAFAAGQILNEKTARSQFMGGMIFGVGMGLTEESVPDLQTGRIVTKDLADYHVPVNADIPVIDVIMVPEKDEHVNPIGAKGIGEIGIVGMAAAIANAVFNATGVRVRDLPITPDKIVTGLWNPQSTKA